MDEDKCYAKLNTNSTAIQYTPVWIKYVYPTEDWRRACLRVYLLTHLTTMGSN